MSALLPVFLLENFWQGYGTYTDMFFIKKTIMDTAVVTVSGLLSPSALVYDLDHDLLSYTTDTISGVM